MPPKKSKFGGVQVFLQTLTGVCRVCRSVSASSKSLFDAGSTIVEQIQFCTGVLMIEHSQLPSLICFNCYAKLTIAHKFKTTCIQSEESLLQIFKDIPIEIVKNELKVEPKDEIEEENSSDNDDLTYVLIESEIKEEVAPKSQPKKQKAKPKNDPKSLHCDKCDMDFKDVSEASMHEKKMHYGPWICEICGKQLNHYTSHYAHLRSHLPPKYACETCDYKASTKPDLRKHMRVHTGEKLYQCEYCSLKYRISSHLRAHIASIHLKVRNHACPRPSCDRRFTTRTQLNRHIDTHDNIKRFECQVCHFCYSRRCQLKKHLLKEHSITMPRVRPGRQRQNVIDDIKKSQEEKKIQNGENHR